MNIRQRLQLLWITWIVAVASCTPSRQTATTRENNTEANNTEKLQGITSQTVPPELNQKQSEIIFAGLSGTPPRFIDSGPDKGLGWVEFQTHEIRKALASDGFIFKTEYMTPARIEHEFKKGTPICTWPVTWNHPKAHFASKPDRLYSLPLDFGTEESRSILINREDLPRFKKHLDSKGDLSLESLVQDASLKTLLIRNKDYDQLKKMLTTVDATGEQSVLPRFQKNVQLLVIRDNRQLAEMLNAHRFDYIFTESIEEQDFTSSKLDQSRFVTLNYTTQHITSIQDPNLERVSFACSISPETLQALPYLNHRILQFRSTKLTEQKAHYRMLLDPRFGKSYDYSKNTIKRFQSDILKGLADQWFEDQQRHFPGLLRLPSQSKAPDLPNLSTGPNSLLKRTPLWRAFRTNDSLVVLNEAEARGFQYSVSHPDDTRFFGDSAAAKELRRKHSWIESSHLETEFQNTSPDFQSVMQSISPSQSASLKELTLFANGLSPEDLLSLHPVLSRSSLKSFTLLHARSDSVQSIVPLLPPTLESLNLSKCSLGLSSIQDQIKGMPLRFLALDDSQLTDTQIQSLLRNLNPNVETLYLGSLFAHFGREGARALGAREWKRLRHLDLSHDNLDDESVQDLLRAIPRRIVTLDLGSNLFAPPGLKALFSRPYLEMKALSLTGSIVTGIGTSVLRLPPNISSLDLKKTGLSHSNLHQLSLPHHLESLELDDNLLGDQSAEWLIRSLANKMSLLSLNSTEIGSQLLEHLLKKSPVRQIAVLNLAKNGLTNSDLEPLRGTPIQVERLDVSANRLTNPGAKLIADRWGSALASLNASGNLISEEGIRALTSHFTNRLIDLSLNSVFNLDVEALATHLPKSVRTLSLASNLLSNQEITRLAPALPRDLSALDLSHSNFGPEGATQLAMHLPPHLISFDFSNAPVGESGTKALSSVLNASLLELFLGPTEISRETFEFLADRLPRALRTLTFIGPQKHGLAALFRKLSPSLQTLRFYKLDIDAEVAQAWSHHWPQNLRMLDMEGASATQAAISLWWKNPPLSLAYIEIDGLQIEEASGKVLFANPLTHVHILGLFNGSISPDAVKVLASQKRYTTTKLVLVNNGFGDAGLREFNSNLLSTAREVLIGNDRFSNRALEQFARTLPQSLLHLHVFSTDLSLEGIPNLIRALPKHLRMISIFGNKIGQKGHDLFKQYKAQKEKENGIPFRLLE